MLRQIISPIFGKIDDSFDAVISINEPDALRNLAKKPLKICWQFLNDFTYCQPGFDNAVDIWLAPGEMLMERLKTMAPKPEKWSVLRLGCDPDLYEDKRVYGRVIWTSSCDRGLHWLLSQWPQIKEAVPEATLKIFYHFTYGSILSIEPNATDQHPHVVEMGQRLRYIKETIKRLKPLGVDHVGSTNRIDMAKEISEASVFISPCDTVAFSEGFSISTLEALASYTMPIVTGVDCLGSIYENSGAIMVKSPIQEHLQEFTNAIIKSLKDKEFADGVVKKCRKFSDGYRWADIAMDMEKIIMDNKKETPPQIIKTAEVKSIKREPVISIVMPTMRVGGLDVVLKGLEKQTTKDFELVLVDGIYKHRKELIAKEAEKYSFQIKHVEPTKNIFPIANYCNSANTGIINASAKLILLITDYTYLPADCVEKHINFHTACPSENIGYMCPHQYKSLPELSSSFFPYKNEDTDLYATELESGKLNNVLWSIFKENFDCDPESLSLDSMGNSDTKLFMAFGIGDQNCFNGKNESLKIEAVLKINGFDEELDGTVPWQDNVFSDMLVKKLGFRWMVDKDNKVYIINPRFVMPWAKRMRPIETNLAIWRRNQGTNYRNTINSWNLRDTRETILKGQK